MSVDGLFASGLFLATKDQTTLLHLLGRIRGEKGSTELTDVRDAPIALEESLEIAMQSKHLRVASKTAVLR